MADFAVITGLANHQPRAVSTKCQLTGDLLADKTAGAGNKQF
jgi:hypothetical protein